MLFILTKHIQQTNIQSSIENKNSLETKSHLQTIFIC